MTTNSAHFGNYPLARPLALPAPRFEHWAAITATISRAFGKLASAATSAATMSAVDPSITRRPSREGFLEQATMDRAMYRL